MYLLGIAYSSTAAEWNLVKRDALRGVDLLKQARTIATEKGDMALVSLVNGQIE